MIQHLKSGRSVQTRDRHDTPIRAKVEGSRADMAQRGDAPLPEYSQQFAHWTPASIRLAAEQFAASKPRPE
jgi:sulfopropanediol 3-dehydrogenase